MKILFTSIIDVKKSLHNRPHQFLKHLLKNHEITVISINDWWKAKQSDTESYSKEFSYIFDNIEYHYYTEKKISPILQEFLFKKKITKLIEENDFDILLNYNGIFCEYDGQKNLVYVYDIADDLIAMIKSSPQIPHGLRNVASSIGKHYINKNIKKSDIVTYTNNYLKNIYKINDDKGTLIPNGVDTNAFKIYKNAKEECNINGFVLGYVGVLREWVNLEPIYRAIKEMNRDIKLLIVGKEGNYIENKNLVKKYDIEERVIFTGNIPYSEIPKYISAMDVCLIPFEHNKISDSALPLKLFEYMACEKPIISTKLKTINDVVGDRILYANNVVEYKKLLNELYNDAWLRSKYGKIGKDFVNMNYDWRIIVEKLENIIYNSMFNVDS